jgi:fermentation-respiration switch protein FrsA (DUF1100 family)
MFDVTGSPAAGIALAALTAMAGLYALLLCLLYLGQELFIFPGAARFGSEEIELAPAPGIEVVSLRTVNGEAFGALFAAAYAAAGGPATAAECPTLLFFYGNGDCAGNCVHLIEQFRALGANVLVPEYLGYGASAGKAGEAGCHSVADAAYAYLASRPGVDPAKIVACGSSLGSGVAIDLASRTPVAGLVTFMAYTSMAEMGRCRFPAVPARVASLLLRHRFESLRKIASVRCPALIVHGVDDRNIPFTMSDRLAAAAGGPVTRINIERAGHNDLFAVGRWEINKALKAFLRGIGPGIQGEPVRHAPSDEEKV